MDVIKILEEAMADEKIDYRRYKALAQEADDPESRAIFEVLANQ